MKKILITQRIDCFPERNEKRDGLDIKLSEIILNLGFLPISVSNCFGRLDKNQIAENIKSLNPHGIILSGGNNLNEYKERDFLEKNLLDFAIKNNKPLLGICRGMQILGNYFGADIEPINNHVNKVRLVKGEINKKVRCFHDHKISKCPDEFIIISTSEDGCIEAIKAKNYPILGIMWHFERDEKLDCIDKNLILDLFK